MRKSSPSAFALAAVCCVTFTAGAAGVSAGTTPPDSDPASSAPASTDATGSTEGAVTTTTTTSSTTTSSTTTSSTTTSSTTTLAPTTTVAAEVERQPLTGVPIDGTLITYTPRPALIVKIDNVGPARPQTGLNQADIVFEEIVEGRATRFAAAFNSTDASPVGPIRSGRTQDVNLLSSFNDPIFAYSGGNAGVNAALAATGWTLLTEGNGMFRSGDRPAPYNLYGNTDDFYAMGGDSGEATPQFEYIAPGTEVDGSPVSSIDVLVGAVNVRWDWDGERGLFLRSQDGNAHQNTDGQVTTNTVVVLLTGYGGSAASSGSPEAQTLGSGDVVVYSNGRKIEGRWTRDDPSQPFTLEANGEPIELAPGRTWVELVDGANYELTDA